ncbi:MAG: hypothetical protein ACXAEU_20095 [Candidatus Hodarchaeales archaeon]
MGMIRQKSTGNSHLCPPMLLIIAGGRKAMNHAMMTGRGLIKT